MIYLRCNCCNFYTLLVCKITKKYDKQSNEIQNFTYGGGIFLLFTDILTMRKKILFLFAFLVLGVTAKAQYVSNLDKIELLGVCFLCQG